MVSVCRCSRGHTWAPAGPAGGPETCPVCGDTAAVAGGPTEATEQTRLFVVAGDRPTPPTSGDLTRSLPAEGRPDEPSFSSLTGMPGSDTSQVEFSASPSPADMPTVDFAPPLVPGYEIVREVGRGGMGVVYKARQLALNRTVALKMILAGSHAGPTERERFRREAESVAALQHQHIVQIFEVGEANGHPYLALEFVDGGSLAEHLSGHPWPAREAAGLVELLARAVHYAHEHGIVHRDLKPGNVLLSGFRIRDPGFREEARDRRPAPPNPESRAPNPVPKITDFGLAKRLDGSDADKATRTGAVMGTPGYIAPEQASGKGKDVGPAADVYALGAILYECLTGRPPFRGETPLDTVLQVMHEEPVPPRRLRPSVPKDLETVCLKCLAKSPGRRYAGAAALADDLRRFLDGEPILARPLSSWGRAVKWAARHPALAVLGVTTAVATVALVAVLSVAYYEVHEAVRAKEDEARAAREQWGRAEALAAENDRQRKEVEARAEELRREADRSRRAAYALQLAQIAALCERDPKRALQLLDDPDRCPPALHDFAWAHLRRLCHREDRVYADHGTGRELYAVAYSPDGALVATGGADGPIRVWDPRTGWTAAVLDGHDGAVRGLAFAPNGRAIASAGADGSVRLWQLPGSILDTAHKTLNLALDRAPYIRPFVPTVPLSAAAVREDAHPGGATCVAFDPTGQTLVSGGADATIKWWAVGQLRPSGDARPLRQVKVSGAKGAAVLCVAFHPDPKRHLLVTGSTDGADVWSAEKSVASKVRVRWGTGPVRAVAFSPDGRLLATAGDGPEPAVRLVSTSDWKEARRLTGHAEGVRGLAFAPDGQSLASAGADHTVRLWEVEDGQERGVLVGHGAAVNGVAFGPARRTVTSVGADGTARVWLTGVRASDAGELFRDSRVRSAAVSESGGAFVTADESGRLRVALTDLARGPEVAPSGVLPLWHVPLAGAPAAAVRATAVAADGGTVFAATDREIFAWVVSPYWGKLPPAGSVLTRMGPLRPAQIPTPGPVSAMAVDRTGRVLATVDPEGVRVWELGTGLLAPGGRFGRPQPRLLPGTAGAREVVFDPKGGRLAVAAGRGVRVLDLSGAVLAEAPDAHGADVGAVAFDPAGARLATGDADGLIRVWAVGPGGLEPRARVAGHAGGVLALGFSPDGRTLASGGADRAVVLWDPETGQERAALTGHADQVVRVRFAADGGKLFTVGRDGAARRWQAEPRAKSPPAAPAPLAAPARRR